MKFTHSFFKLILIVGILGGQSTFYSSQLLAQQAKIDELAPDISKLTTSEEILKKACSFLGENQSFSVEMDITYDDVLTTGEKVQFSAMQKAKVNKPDRLFSEYIGDERHTEFRYDGQKFTLYSPPKNFYVSKATKTTLDEAFSEIENKYGVTIPLSNMFISDPCTRIFQEVKQVRFIGTNMVRGKKGYHLLLNGDDRDIQIWVSQDKQPLLLKAIITYLEFPEKPQYTAVFTNWNFQTKFSEDDFKFDVPENASYIEFLSPQDN